MIEVRRIVAMQVEMVDYWHKEGSISPFEPGFQDYQEGWLAIAVRQHRYNYDLWHQEDIARSPDVSDAKIAEVKRAIDRFNQQRNDWIEKIDDWLTSYLDAESIQPNAGARLNTETPGSAVDRLSIMSLRLYHLREQLERSDVDPAHVAKVHQRIEICQTQQSDLANSLTELLDDILAGQKRHRTYRQFKMYNDPTMNPYLYKRNLAP